VLPLIPDPEIHFDDARPGIGLFSRATTARSERSFAVFSPKKDDMRYLLAHSSRRVLVGCLLLGLGIAMGCGGETIKDTPAGQPSARLKKFETYKAKAQSK
jgi:hypothetical protein